MNHALTEIKAFFALIDLFAILPFYIELILQADMNAFFKFSILRTFRLLRVFRPFRYSSTILLTIEVMILSTRRSKHALLALSFFVAMALIVFSTLLYFAERGVWDDTLEAYVDEEGVRTQFDSIPAAAWFVLVSTYDFPFFPLPPPFFSDKELTNHKPLRRSVMERLYPAHFSVVWLRYPFSFSECYSSPCLPSSWVENLR